MKPARRTFTAISCIAAIALATQAFAGGAPTENDMQAAYCLGVLNTQKTLMYDSPNGFKPTIDNPKMLKSIEKEKADHNAKIQRIRAYLFTEGFNTTKDPSGSGTAALMHPMQEGQKDAGDCLIGANNNTPQRAACFMQCIQASKNPDGTPNQDQSYKCAQESCTPEICKKIVPCSDLSFLPF